MAGISVKDARRLPFLVQRRYERARPDSQLFALQAIHSLSDYLTVCHSIVTPQSDYWFRGHSDYRWGLIPSALRYDEKSKRDVALDLIRHFKRFAEIRLPSLPPADEHLKWMQIAQHYCLPTRLLDWTRNPAVALYFACQEADKDGLVFVLNPVDLNRWTAPKRPRVFDANDDADIIRRLLKLDGRQSDRGPRTIAIDPVFNSERIMLQRGCFTLHGSKHFALTEAEAPGLVYVPILKDAKPSLREQLTSVGIDEMSIFPEIEHLCAHLKWAYLHG